jgi:5-methylcytosine-specific restriction endonuclease McrA
MPPAVLLKWAAMLKVLVLNTTYEPLNVCSVRRALVLMLKDKAEVVEHSGTTLHAQRLAFAAPHVIRLLSYVSVPRSATKRISRRAVFARDQFCGAQKHLTVDHVVPRSKGGADSWDNVVTSCAPCNLRKGDRLLPADGLRLARKPRPPEPFSFVFMEVDHIHDSWRPYLSWAGQTA